LIVNRPAGIRLVDDVMLGDKVIGLVTQRDPELDDPAPGDLFPTACIDTILKML
jgi:ATP-dependent Lon protease